VQTGRINVLVLGFGGDTEQMLWTFFSSFTLAILIAYQAIAFCFAFYRLINALINQRNFEISSTDAVHLIKGTGWIAAALMLGAIETLIGFAEGGFYGAMIRRVLRLLSRAFLIVGMVKG
jgi:hypothetical protein